MTIGAYGGCRWTARQAPTSGSRIGRYAELVDKVASGLVSTGLQAKDKVAVYGSNSPEWMMAMQVGPSSSVLSLSTSRTVDLPCFLPLSVH